MKPYCMISNAKTFAFSAENPTGARAGGSKGGDCTKLSPTVAIRAGETVTLVDTDGPGMIQSILEIFSRNPDFIILEEDAILTPLPIDDEISSLSAILLNEAYYELLKTGQQMVDGIPVLSPTCLIPFKAKAWLDLTERKLNGEQVDSKNIKKHKNDVFRLAQLITVNTRQVLSSEIAEDMKKFLSEIADETVDLKSLGIRGTDKQKIIDMLYLCYNLNDNT